MTDKTMMTRIKGETAESDSPEPATFDGGRLEASDEAPEADGPAGTEDASAGIDGQRAGRHMSALTRHLLPDSRERMGIDVDQVLT